MSSQGEAKLEDVMVGGIVTMGGESYRVAYNPGGLLRLDPQRPGVEPRLLRGDTVVLVDPQYKLQEWMG